jgi:tRNA 2-thiocytidine biosynthesis protein TtcA
MRRVLRDLVPVKERTPGRLAKLFPFIFADPITACSRMRKMCLNLRLNDNIAPFEERSAIVKTVDLEKILLRKVGEAIGRFRMIRDGDRVAVGLSGGKDSVTLLEALLRLQKRAPVRFTVCAFTIEQGKFLSPIRPLGDYLTKRGIEWTYVEDKPSLDLLTEQPDHGCDLCSRFRRRAVYEVARQLSANVIAFGHTADDFCEAFLRNAMFTGRLSALPAITWSRKREFRLVRPLVYVPETLTRDFAVSLGAPVIPCGCSQKTGTVRRTLRDLFTEIERDHPFLKETLLSAMSKIEPGRLLDTRFLDFDRTADEAGFLPDEEALVTLHTAG